MADMANHLMIKVLIAVCLVVVVYSKPLDQIYKYEKYVLYSGTQNTDNQHTLFVTGTGTVVFKVRACSGAHLRMAEVFLHQARTTDLKIGASQNTKTILKYVDSNEVVASVDTPDILHCGELRTFWVSWAYGYFRFGRGSALGVGRILEVQKTGDLNHDVSTITLSTDQDIAGVWEIEESQFYSLASTPPPATGGLVYPYTWRTVQHAPGGYFYFTAMACRAVSLYLGSSVGAADYTIQIEANEVKIMKGTDQLAQTSTTGTLKCGTPKTFWVSWWAGAITLGSGFIKYQGQIVQAPDARMGNIYALGFAAGQGAEATFDLTATIDEVYAFATVRPPSGNYEYTHWMHVSESNFITFGVQACQDVSIIFSDTFGKSSSNAVVLELNQGGTGQNTLKSDGNVVTDTSAILDCEAPATLWASFTNNKFRVGLASMKGISTFLAADTNLQASMNGVGFASRHADRNATWIIGTIEPGLLRMQTESNTEGSYDTWASGTRRYYKEFKLDMCGKSAMINVAPCLGCQTMGSTGSYHIKLEKDGGSESVTIFQRKESDTELDKHEESGLTQCMTYTSFFISWYDNELKFGKGDLTSGTTLVKMDEPIPYDVNAISLVSEGKSIWEMDMETGEQLSFQTQDISLGYNWMKVSPRLAAQRFWATGTNVELVLSPTYGSTNNGYSFKITPSLITLSENGKQVKQYAGATIDRNIRKLMVVSWQGNKVVLGPETDGEPYISYDTGSLAIEGIGILPSGVSSEVRMPSRFGSEVSFTTTATMDTIQTWMGLEFHDTLIFNVKASANAELVLAPYMYHDDVNKFYRIIIGYSGNQLTAIFQGSNLLASVSTPNILSADAETSLWLIWYHGEIVLGRGHHVGNDIIFSWYDPSPSPITAVAFVGGGNQVHWRVGLVPYGNLEDLAPEQPNGGGGLSGGAVAGIVIGVLILVAIIGGFAFMYTTGRLQRYMGGSSLPSMGNSNPPQQFNNPLSYPDTRAVPSGQQSAA